MEAFRLTCYGNEINNNRNNILVMPALLSSFLFSIMNYATYVVQTAPSARMCRLNNRYDK